MCTNSDTVGRFQPTNLNEFENDFLKQQVKNILNWLNTREKTVLTLRFGVDDGKARTQKEVGKFLNVSAERIRQIEFKALSLLRDKMQNQGISKLSFSY